MFITLFTVCDLNYFSKFETFAKSYIINETNKKNVKKVEAGKIIQMAPRLGEENIDSGHMNNNSAYELLGWKPVVELEKAFRTFDPI